MVAKFKKRRNNNSFKPRGKKEDLGAPENFEAPIPVTESSLKSKKSKYLIKNEKFSAKDLGLNLETSNNHGAVYIGCLPFGFYDSKLKAYLQQFGEITRMNVPRSKKTGTTLGYAFVEFKHENVAKIVSKTMNNYLMFKKLLKCDFISQEKIGKNMFALNSRNTPETCRGTRRRILNQQRMDKARGTEFVTKQKLKVLSALKRMQKLGLTIDPNQVKIKTEDVEKIGKEEYKKRCKASAAKRELMEMNNGDVDGDVESFEANDDEVVSGKSILRTSKGKAKLTMHIEDIIDDDETDEINDNLTMDVDEVEESASKKKLGLTKSPKKIQTPQRNLQLTEEVDESVSKKKLTKSPKKTQTPHGKGTPKRNLQLTEEVEESASKKKRSKSPKKTRTPRGKETPKRNKTLTMHIDEVDEEIIIRTPPNVVKRIKTGKQTVICSPSASTVLRTEKRPTSTPLESVTQTLFTSDKKSPSPGRFVRLQAKQKTPKQGTPKERTPKQRTPKQRTPKQKTPKQKTPKQNERSVEKRKVKSPKQ